MTVQLAQGASHFWSATDPLVLGSGSAARRALLESAGIPVRVVKPDTEEAALAAKLIADSAPPRDIALHLARAKSESVAKKAPNGLILTADQTLDHNGTLFMKPENSEHLRAQLLRLRASRHELHSAAVLRQGDTILWSGAATARLVMRDFSDDFLDHYIAVGGPSLLDTVGGYQMEALGAHLFTNVEGDHATILGLPLRAILEALRDIGALER